MLTNTGAAFQPVVSADSRWVYFTTPATGVPTTWKVGIDGGEPVRISDAYFRVTSVSPDGSTLLGIGWDQTERRSVVAMVPSSGGTPTFVRGIAAAPVWTPDGRAISFAEVRDGVLTIASVPRAGGAPKLLLKLEDNVYALAWARDGRLALARGTGTSDVVLIARQPIKG
jgi:Tol biopolymer transport system component